MARFINPTLTAKIAAVLCLAAFIGTHRVFAQEEIKGIEPMPETNISMPETNIFHKPQKSPVVAFVLSSVLPGAGQAYNGEWGKGALQFGGTAFGVGLFLHAESELNDFNDWGAWITAERTAILGIIGAFIGVGFKVWSMIDAPISANRINKQAQSAHLFQMDAGPFVVGADPVVRRGGVGGALTIRF